MFCAEVLITHILSQYQLRRSELLVLETYFLLGMLSLVSVTAPNIQ